MSTKKKDLKETPLKSLIKTSKAKSKEKKSKIQKNDDILVYRTPIKENSFYKAPSEIKGLVSPDTTKKNLLLLFQQVNK